MKKFWFAAALAFALAPMIALAADYTEGIEYEALSQPQPVETGNKIEVREFFWYGCPHCFHFEPTLLQWLKHKPRDVEFVRTPAVANPNWAVQGRAYYAFQALGVLGRLHEAFFNAIHVQDLPLDTPDAIADWVGRQGVDEKKFKQVYNSFAVASRMRAAGELGAREQVDSVPTLIVQGRYKVTPARAGGNEETIKIVDFLIKKVEAERRGRK